MDNTYGYADYYLSQLPDRINNPYVAQNVLPWGYRPLGVSILDLYSKITSPLDTKADTSGIGISPNLSQKVSGLVDKGNSYLLSNNWANAGILAGALVGGEVAKKAISNGFSTAAGDAIGNVGASVGAGVAMVNPIVGGAVIIGSKVLGGLVNAGWGYKTDEAKLSKVNSNIADLKSTAGLASNYDSITDPTLVSSDTSVYKGGWFKKGKARRANNELKENLADAKDFAGRLIKNQVTQLNKSNMSELLGSYVSAFGGPLHYAFGGDLMTAGADFGTGLTHIDLGDTHENNPFEGVRMGLDLNGTPNLVEEGECIYNDYVFSNRLTVPELTGDKLTLDLQILNRYKGKTYADAAKKMEKDCGLEERPNDNIARRTFDSMLEALKNSLELEKAKKDLLQLDAQIADMSPEEFAEYLDLLEQMMQLLLAMMQLQAVQLLQLQQPMTDENGNPMPPELLGMTPLDMLLMPPLEMPLLDMPQGMPLQMPLGMAYGGFLSLLSRFHGCGGSLYKNGGDLKYNIDDADEKYIKSLKRHTALHKRTYTSKHADGSDIYHTVYTYDLPDNKKAMAVHTKGNGINEELNIYPTENNGYYYESNSENGVLSGYTGALPLFNEPNYHAFGGNLYEDGGQQMLTPLDVLGQEMNPNDPLGVSVMPLEMQLQMPLDMPLDEALEEEYTDDDYTDEEEEPNFWDLDESPEDMSTSDLDDLIDQIKDYAKELGDRGLLREAKKAEKAKRDKKVEFVTEAIEEILDVEAEELDESIPESSEEEYAENAQPTPQGMEEEQLLQNQVGPQVPQSADAGLELNALEGIYAYGGQLNLANRFDFGGLLTASNCADYIIGLNNDRLIKKNRAVIEKVADALIKKGYNSKQVIGILINCARESRFLPNAKNRGHYGILLWDNQRLKRGSSLDAQINTLLSELDTTVFKGLNFSSDREAYSWWLNNMGATYNPKGKKRAIPASSAREIRRGNRYYTSFTHSKDSSKKSRGANQQVSLPTLKAPARQTPTPVREVNRNLLEVVVTPQHLNPLVDNSQDEDLWINDMTHFLHLEANKYGIDPLEFTTLVGDVAADILQANPNISELDAYNLAYLLVMQSKFQGTLIPVDLILAPANIRSTLLNPTDIPYYSMPRAYTHRQNLLEVVPLLITLTLPVLLLPLLLVPYQPSLEVSFEDALPYTDGLVAEYAKKYFNGNEQEVYDLVGDALRSLGMDAEGIQNMSDDDWENSIYQILNLRDPLLVSNFTALSMPNPNTLIEGTPINTPLNPNAPKVNTNVTPLLSIKVSKNLKTVPATPKTATLPMLLVPKNVDENDNGTFDAKAITPKNLLGGLLTAVLTLGTLNDGTLSPSSSSALISLIPLGENTSVGGRTYAKNITNFRELKKQLKDRGMTVDDLSKQMGEKITAKTFDNGIEQLEAVGKYLYKRDNDKALNKYLSRFTNALLRDLYSSYTGKDATANASRSDIINEILSNTDEDSLGAITNAVRDRTRIQYLDDLKNSNETITVTNPDGTTTLLPVYNELNYGFFDKDGKPLIKTIDFDKFNKRVNLYQSSRRAGSSGHYGYTKGKSNENDFPLSFAGKSYKNIRDYENSLEYKDFTNLVLSLDNPNTPMELKVQLLLYLKALDNGTPLSDPLLRKMFKLGTKDYDFSNLLGEDRINAVNDLVNSLSADWKNQYKHRRGVDYQSEGTTVPGDHLFGIYHFDPELTAGNGERSLVFYNGKQTSFTGADIADLMKNPYYSLTLGLDIKDANGNITHVYTLTDNNIPLEEQQTLEVPLQLGNGVRGTPYPKFPMWPYFAGMGLLGAALLNNVLSPIDYSNADALINAGTSAGTYTPIHAKPIGDYLKYRPLDRNYEGNKLLALAGATRRALTNLANGNRASASAGILASDYNYMNALGELDRKAAESNRDHEAKVKEFNRGTNLYNSQSALEADKSNLDALIKAKSLNLEATLKGYAMRLALEDAKANAISQNISGLANTLYNYAGAKMNNDRIQWATENGVYGPMRGYYYKDLDGNNQLFLANLYLQDPYQQIDANTGLPIKRKASRGGRIFRGLTF